MKVLIALDDSDCSALALESVVERLWAKDAEFRVITVVEPAHLHASLTGMYCEPMLAAQIEFENYSRNRVQRRVEKLEKAFPENSVSGETLLGYVAESILDQAKSWNADLIVLGSHGRKGFSRFFLGSVAERVAGHAPCSVEIVKQKISSSKLGESAPVETESTPLPQKVCAEMASAKYSVGGKANS